MNVYVLSEDFQFYNMKKKLCGCFQRSCLLPNQDYLLEPALTLFTAHFIIIIIITASINITAWLRPLLKTKVLKSFFLQLIFFAVFLPVQSRSFPLTVKVVMLVGVFYCVIMLFIFFAFVYLCESKQISTFFFFSFSLHRKAFRNFQTWN